MEKLLDHIASPADLKALGRDQLDLLAAEIREEIIKTVSRTGGHLASNLGVVELTIALHYVFKSPTDKLVWDVGHQTYTHKLVTGRRQKFKTLRQFGGLSGFPKREESPHDCFEAGHSSTSISAALGMAVVCGVIWGVVRMFVPFFFLNLLLGPGVGYAIGEVVSISVNRKRGKGLAAVAGIAVAISFLVSIFLLFVWHLLDLLALALGIFVAVTRLR